MKIKLLKQMSRPEVDFFVKASDITYVLSSFSRSLYLTFPIFNASG